MNKKVVSLALVFSLLGGFLVACEQDTGGGTDGTSPSPGAPAESPSPTTSPSP